MENLIWMYTLLYKMLSTWSIDYTHIYTLSRDTAGQHSVNDLITASYRISFALILIPVDSHYIQAWYELAYKYRTRLYMRHTPAAHSILPQIIGWKERQR